MLGRSFLVAGVALDGYSLYSEYQDSRVSHDFNNTYRESARIAAGWTGAAILGANFAEIGLVVCAPATPLAQAACGVLGGVVGSALGYYGYGTAATNLYDIHQTPRLSLLNRETKQVIPRQITTFSGDSSLRQGKDTQSSVTTPKNSAQLPDPTHQYEQLLRLNPNDHHTYDPLAELYRLQGKIKLADTLTVIGQKLVKGTITSDDFSQLGHQYTYAGLAEEADRNYQHAASELNRKLSAAMETQDDASFREAIALGGNIREVNVPNSTFSFSRYALVKGYSAALDLLQDHIRTEARATLAVNLDTLLVNAAKNNPPYDLIPFLQQTGVLNRKLSAAIDAQDDAAFREALALGADIYQIGVSNAAFAFTKYALVKGYSATVDLYQKHIPTFARATLEANLDTILVNVAKSNPPADLVPFLQREGVLTRRLPATSTAPSVATYPAVHDRSRDSYYMDDIIRRQTLEAKKREQEFAAQQEASRRETARLLEQREREHKAWMKQQEQRRRAEEQTRKEQEAILAQIRQNWSGSSAFSGGFFAPQRSYAGIGISFGNGPMNMGYVPYR